MEKINEISVWLQAALLAGLGVRLTYCLIRLTSATDDAQQYRKRIKNTIIIAVIAVMIFTIKDLVMHYYYAAQC